MKRLLALLRPISSGLLFFVPIALGVVLLVWASSSRREPEKIPEQEQARKLRIIEVQPATLVPRAVGFGESRASQLFQAVAEVKGKINELHPELKAGSFIRRGELLVGIDTADVELSIQRLEAEIARSEASLAELEATQENLEASLAIEKSSLEVSKREFDRLEQLVRQSNAVSPAELDQQRRSVLAQQQSVQNLNSSLNLIPAQIQSAEANISVAESNLATSRRDLKRCQILAPFNCRLGPVDLELNEFVSVGAQLFTAQSIDRIEVEAQFSLNTIARLIRPGDASPSLVGNNAATPQENLRKFFDVDATVRYGTGGVSASRDAKFERIREQLDSQARTVGVVVSIDSPYEPTERAGENTPPPVPGIYCEVELRAKPLENAIVVPRSAVRDGCVFVVTAKSNDEYRLHRQPVQLGTVQSNFAVVREGLEAGDLLVVSDPTPAIEDMLVTPEIDAQMQEAIRTQSGRQGGVR